MTELDYEDTLMYGFESVELRRENAALKRKLRETEQRLLQTQHANSGVKGVAAIRAQADKYERLYRAALARNEILNRKVRDLGG